VNMETQGTKNIRIPENIHCLALNYPGVGSNDAEMPLYFVKSRQAYCTSGAQVHYPDGSNKVWTEVELGIVLARAGVGIGKLEAEDYIAGYVVCADISCENIHLRDHHLGFSKSRAGFCPCSGSVIFLPLEQAMQLDIFTEINGKTTQTGNTASMLLNPAEIISYLSSLTRLEAGDLILTGTPPGYQNNMLKHGDKVHHCIIGLGEVFYEII